MSAASENNTHSDRQHWMSVLARADISDLERFWSEHRLENEDELEVLRSPETGLVMVRGRAGGDGQRFNLGEATVSRCSVRHNDGPIGHACVLGRNKQHARLAASFDAFLQTSSHQDRLLDQVIRPLAKSQQAKAKQRASKAAATKVDFFTMVRGEND